jgi:multidrug efflux system outer membrane protein
MLDRIANVKGLRVLGALPVFALALAGCAVGPDYRRPDIEVPAGWRLGKTEAEEISNVAWWDQFQDPVLPDLVRSALANNKDLQIATANVDQAFAQYGIVRSARFPQATAGVDAARERASVNAPVPRGGAFNDFGLNLSASFELDVWGRLRRETQSARASLLASQEGRRTVVLTVVTTVTEGYIQLRALDRQLEIARSTSQTLAEAARLQRIRFEGGAIPESDYRQAESQYRDAVARVPELEREIARQEDFISVLLGRNPAPIPRGHDIDHLMFPAVPAGLPASLLQRRPDIRQAEQQLMAANADIGVAKAAYFPDISLTALLGLESTQLSDLFKGPSKVWSFGGGAVQPIFSGGRIEAQVAQAEALQREALHNYEKSIISAFQDAEDALVDRGKYEQVRDEQSRNVEELKRFRDLAQLRYQQGATIYLEVANAEQSLFNAELAYVTAQSQLFQSYANLYKAMGGGWIRDAEAVVPNGVAANTGGL